MNDRKFNNQKFSVCSHCGYDKNPLKAKRCQKCDKPLNLSLLQNNNEGTQPKSKSFQDWLLTPWVIRVSFSLLFLFFGWLIFSLFVTVSKLNNADSVANSGGNIENISSGIKLYDSIKDVENVPEGTFNYGGALLFATLTANGLNDAIATAYPNFRLRYTEPRDEQPGGRQGIAMLLNGQLSFANSGGSLRDTDYSKAQERGFQLKQVPVAIDALVVFTHPNISIPGLSIEQVQDIYKGKLTNWKQVGGPDLTIVPFARDPKVANLLNDLLGKEINQLSSRVRFIRDYTVAIRQVASTPGAISFGANAPVLGQQTIRPLAIAKGKSQEYVQPFTDNGKRINVDAMRNGSYPITRRLFVIIREDGTIDEVAGKAYTSILLSKEGQQIVEKAGLIPIR
ncbi:PstS family phosphate ABC transporter substrate-binding protein [Scytonema sp. NUACC21]